MASLAIYNSEGKEVGKYDIDPADIAPSINKQLMHDVVVMYQANLRQGTHKTKTRAEVSGTTKKMYRQKGTGNARAGSKRAAQRVGGGHVNAKRNRDYSYRLPKKAVKLATRMALASKIQDEELVVIDQFDIDAPKTKEMVTIINNLNLGSESILITTEGYSENVYKSARNIAGVEVLPASDLNTLAILKPKKVLVTKDALDQIKERAAK